MALLVIAKKWEQLKHPSIYMNKEYIMQGLEDDLE